MQNKLDKYTQEVKARLDKNYLSPMFIRLANLLYVNEHYEECISVCKTGLEIYPRYLTAKLILLKALLKAEYLNEAEILFKEIRSKIVDKSLLSKLKGNIQTLRTISKQEKIYYHKAVKSKTDFKTFEKKFHEQENLFTDFTIDNLFDNEVKARLNSDKEYQDFVSRFESFHFDKQAAENRDVQAFPAKQVQYSNPDEELLKKIKIVTETLADIYSEQGNFKEAFDAYNILLRAGSSNSKRIEEKLHELERNMQKYDN